MDRIELRGMSFQGRHGARAAEKQQSQEFTVDLEVECDIEKAAKSDALEDTIDYTRLRSIVREIIEGPSTNLLETLAAKIAQRTLEVDGVGSVSVRVAKHPASMHPIDSAAVNIKRTRANQK